MPERNGLISTAELADILDQPDLRLFDCTTYLEYQPPKAAAMPYIAVPGRHTFEAGHIPGADFLDLQGEFSDPDTALRFMMPDVAQLEAAFGRHGVSDAQPGGAVLHRHADVGDAVLVDAAHRSASTTSSVLDGGLDKWKPEGRAIETGPAKGYPPATFTAKPQAGFFVDKHETLAATAERGTVVVNALNPQLHKGLEPSRYGRPGRIPGSCNVSAATLLDPQTKAFVPLADAEAKFEAQGITKDKRVVAYCGGGISATDRPVPAAPARLRQPHASTTARWANGRRIRRCRSRRVKLSPRRHCERSEAIHLSAYSELTDCFVGYRSSQ